ncbi:hypothetical protein [Oryza sativa Japonica Group]|uniref:Uncharacterized protein P0034C09.28 n=1 Tax=Oryza sativa subsp. japonica TaxID=39947 RepID=Q5N7R6_ORYSJ|nr:hypothetical protein [Oryza sativa Japonica Group]
MGVVEWWGAMGGRHRGCRRGTQGGGRRGGWRWGSAMRCRRGWGQGRHRRGLGKAARLSGAICIGVGEHPTCPNHVGATAVPVPSRVAAVPVPVPIRNAAFSSPVASLPSPSTPPRSPSPGAPPPSPSLAAPPPSPFLAASPSRTERRKTERRDEIGSRIFWSSQQ